ncbi:MAG: hypothetical protein RBG13Loki_0198 [Promethearchaeota archaeon CR_4]|nr:MAG: hypothetical protein RBG13Loki_0198 [Candidatus Lokiarchaeota archaeon CR_4]
MIITLGSERGTPLWTAPVSGVTIELVAGNTSQVAGILGDLFFAQWPSKQKEIRTPLAFMLINLGKSPVKFSLSTQMSQNQILWDPYVFEHNIPAEINPNVFKQTTSPISIPEGYVDTLSKWYSVKYTYQDYNLIFLRPQICISFQNHAQRGEHWEIMAGSPIVVAGSLVVYNAKVGEHFDLPLGHMHGLINPSKTEWTAIKETWSGHFDEKDIIRIFNPNHYVSPKTK